MTMGNRKLIRPDMRKDGGSRPVRRKQSPPEQTNAEEFYYLKQMASRTPMIIQLTSGEYLIRYKRWDIICVLSDDVQPNTECKHNEYGSNNDTISHLASLPYITLILNDN